MRFLVGLAFLGLLVYQASALDALQLLDVDPKTLASLAGVPFPKLNSGKTVFPPCNVTESEEITAAKLACEEELRAEATTQNIQEPDVQLKEGETGAGPGGRMEQKSRTAGRHMKKMALQQCVFDKLGLLAADGTLVADRLEDLVNAHSGPESGKEIMVRVTKSCFEKAQTEEPEGQLTAVAECVKGGMAKQCLAHDFLAQSPAMGLIVAGQAAHKCMSGLTLSPMMTWSRLMCRWEQMHMFAEKMLEVAKTVKLDDDTEQDKMPEREDEPIEKDNDEQAKDKTDEQFLQQRRVQRAANPAVRTKNWRTRQSKKAEREAEKVEKLRELLGSGEEAVEMLSQSVLDTARCTHEHAGTLTDDTIDVDMLEEIILEADGHKHIKNVIMVALDHCGEIDPTVDAMTKCMAFQLFQNCGTVGAASRPRRPRRPRPGRPARVGARRVPQQLTGRLNAGP